MVTHLRPEEDQTGAGQPTTQPDTIKNDQFREGMQQVFAEHAHLQGEQWWQGMMIQGACDIKRTQKKWTSGIRGMEEALKDCSIFKLSGRAKELRRKA